MIARWFGIQNKTNLNNCVQIDAAQQLMTDQTVVVIISRRVTPSPFFRRCLTLTIITARNEVGARLYFHRRLWFCSQGGSTWTGTPRDQVHPLGPGAPPRTRYPPGTRYTPLEQCMLGDTGNKRAVRILLECILVYFVSSVLVNQWKYSWWLFHLCTY